LWEITRVKSAGVYECSPFVLPCNGVTAHLARVRLGIRTEKLAYRHQLLNVGYTEAITLVCAYPRAPEG
jgi:hypothetical protein